MMQKVVHTNQKSYFENFCTIVIPDSCFNINLNFLQNFDFFEGQESFENIQNIETIDVGHDKTTL